MRLNLLVFLLFLLSFSFACLGQSEFKIPALIGEDNGGLISISAKVIPGNGNIYLSVDPNTGISTQDSLKEAVEYAFTKSNKPLSDCDVLMSIDKNTASLVEGPSGGRSVVVIVVGVAVEAPTNGAVAGLAAEVGVALLFPTVVDVVAVAAPPDLKFAIRSLSRASMDCRTESVTEVVVAVVGLGFVVAAEPTVGTDVVMIVAVTVGLAVVVVVVVGVVVGDAAVFSTTSKFGKTQTVCFVSAAWK
jgi:hypothetical protein